MERVAELLECGKKRRGRYPCPDRHRTWWRVQNLARTSDCDIEPPDRQMHYICQACADDVRAPTEENGKLMTIDLGVVQSAITRVNANSKFCPSRRRRPEPRPAFFLTFRMGFGDMPSKLAPRSRHQANQIRFRGPSRPQPVASGLAASTWPDPPACDCVTGDRTSAASYSRRI